MPKKGKGRPLSPELHHALGASLRDFRLARELTLEELADAGGTYAGNLSRIEKAKQGVSLGALEAICGRLNISLREFFEAVELGAASERRGVDIARAWPMLHEDTRRIIRDIIRVELQRMGKVRPADSAPATKGRAIKRVPGVAGKHSPLPAIPA